MLDESPGCKTHLLILVTAATESTYTVAATNIGPGGSDVDNTQYSLEHKERRGYSQKQSRTGRLRLAKRSSYGEGWWVGVC